MKKFFLISALAATATAVSAQDFIAGLDFETLPSVSSDIAFDTGTTTGFTLNLKSNSSDDSYSFNGYTATGWAASGDTYTDGTTNYTASQFPQIPITVAAVSGFAASTSSFGNTSAAAQGFGETAGIAFGDAQGNQSIGGQFTISVGTALTDASISFDIAALVSQNQTTGSITVNGNSVSVTDAAVNQTVNLGTLASGSLITFNLSGLSNGATFDNFMVAGTVPEPSTYAAIFGVIALAIAVVRRRRA